MTSISPQDRVGIAPAGAVHPSCRIPGCEIPAAANARDYCQAHHDAYLTRAFELTTDIGRGSHE